MAQAGIHGLIGTAVRLDICTDLADAGYRPGQPSAGCG
jgi:hypothetical protein